MRDRSRLVSSFGLAVALFWAAQHIYVPFLPVYAKAQGATLSLVGAVLASYGLVQAVLRLPLGIVSDRTRRRKPFVVVGFAAVVVSCLGLAWSPRPEWLGVFRALAGAAASTWAATTVLFASYHSGEEAVRAVSWAAVFQQVGLVAASVLGALVGGAWGLVAPFYAGALLSALGLLLIAGAPEEYSAATGPVHFARLAKAITSPRLFGISVVCALAMYVNYTVNGFVPVYAEQVGASTAQLGWLVAAGQVAATGAALGLATMKGRWPERALVITTLLVLTGSIVAMARSASLLPLAVARVVYGLSYGPLYPTLMALSIKSAAIEERASAMSVFTAVYAVGMFVGPMVSGVVAERVGLTGMFGVTSLVGVLALVLAVLSIPAA